MREKFERFDKYMKHKGLNDNQVTVECKLSQGLLGQARKGKSDLGAKAIDKILNTYQDLSKVWLMTGEGDMLSSTSSAKPQQSKKAERVTDDEAYKVPLVPVSALAGSLNDFSLSVKRDDCETVISPIKDIDMAIKISGDSMKPNTRQTARCSSRRSTNGHSLNGGASMCSTPATASSSSASCPPTTPTRCSAKASTPNIHPLR